MISDESIRDAIMHTHTPAAQDKKQACRKMI